MTETELDRVLSGWFADGPEVLPMESIAEALREVATVRQDGTIPRSVRSVGTRRRLPALIAAGVAVAVLAGIAIGIDPALVGVGPTATAPTSQSPTTTASPTSSSRASTPITSNADGFSLVLPPDWRWAARRSPSTQRFEDQTADRSLTVSIGGSIVEGDSATACAPERGGMVECNIMTIGYSIPYLTDRSYEALDGALVGFLDRCGGRCPITRSETTLGPDRAIRLDLTMDDRRLTYVAAMHGYRPVILSWDEPSATPDPAVLDAIRETFTYVGEDPTATPKSYEDPLAPALFRNEAAGYEVSLPVSWIDGLTADEAVILDGLTIIAGDPDGRLQVCRAFSWTCGGEPITTIQALESAILSIGPGMTATEHHADTTLGGEPARTESVRTPRGYLLGPPAWYSVYTIHDGRPYILAFDHWRLRRGDISQSFVNEVVASFRFID